MGSCEVAVVVLLLAHSGWVEQMCGAAVVNGDQRQAVVQATLAAVKSPAADPPTTITSRSLRIA